jgi:hypothetical protein
MHRAQDAAFRPRRSRRTRELLLSTSALEERNVERHASDVVSREMHGWLLKKIWHYNNPLHHPSELECTEVVPETPRNTALPIGE